MTGPRRRLPPWSWPGVVATILALALGFGWCAAIIVAALSDHPTRDADLNTINSLGQTMAGAVAAFLGYQVGIRGHAQGHQEGRDQGRSEGGLPPADDDEPGSR